MTPSADLVPNNGFLWEELGQQFEDLNGWSSQCVDLQTLELSAMGIEGIRALGYEVSNSTYVKITGVLSPEWKAHR